MVQFGIDVYIPQVKPHSSPWFSAPSAAAIANRNHFFCLHELNKSSESKVKFRQASNLCKRVLEAANLAYATKTNESITSQKLGSQDFWQLVNRVLNKVKSAVPPLFAQRCCLLHLIKQNCSLKTFLITLISMTRMSLYLFFFLELI